jgi:hypothetical protein
MKHDVSPSSPFDHDQIPGRRFLRQGTKEDAMIPTRHAYYERRAREHRRLASNATAPQQRLVHDRLAEAYRQLARQYFLRPPVKVKAGLMAPGKG